MPKRTAATLEKQSINRIHNKEPVTEYTPLSVAESHFLANYIRMSNPTQALLATPEFAENVKGKSAAATSVMARRILNQPNVQRELRMAMDEARKLIQASADEVMEYFTKVMRGEVKDQFGLDAPLAERTKAAQELAKRTVDIENREAGKSDQVISVKIDWKR